MNKMNLFKKIAALILSAAVAASVLCVFAEAGEKKDTVSVIVEVDESADPKLIADVLGDKGYLKAGFVISLSGTVKVKYVSVEPIFLLWQYVSQMNFAVTDLRSLNFFAIS